MSARRGAARVLLPFALHGLAREVDGAVGTLLHTTLDLPDFRDNFESRLILLKRRLDEREAPIRIEKTGRGRFRLVVQRPVLLADVVP